MYKIGKYICIIRYLAFDTRWIDVVKMFDENAVTTLK